MGADPVPPDASAAVVANIRLAGGTPADRDGARVKRSDKIPALRVPADGTTGSTKTFSGTLNKASIAAARQASVAAHLPRKARRRIVWDSQLRLRIFWLSVFFAALAFFWGWRFQQYSRGPKRVLFGWSLPFAKACGNAMKIVIWPVLILPLSYVFTTSLRLTWIDRYVPFDIAVPFHMMVAMIGGLLALMHTFSHMADYAHAAHQPADEWAAAFPLDPTPQSFGKLMNKESTYLGFGMLAVLFVMFMFASPYPRKFQWLRRTAVGKVLNDYDWFWTSHKIGGGLFYIMLILHPLPGNIHRVENPFKWNANPAEWGVSDTWMYITIPICIRLLDRTIRWWRRNRKDSHIVGAEFMPDGVVALQFSRPKNFHFRPGMYLYLCIPAVAKVQWHPISLASSPSADSLAVLIRDGGDWATKLHAVLREQLESAQPASDGDSTPLSSAGGKQNPVLDLELPQPLLRVSPLPGPLRARFQDHGEAEKLAAQSKALAELQLLVDGPFGAPAVAYARYPVVLLVGAGIGVTPFLSILADAVEQHAARAAAAAAGAQQQSCGVTSDWFVKNFNPPSKPVQKVHFHWLIREPTIPRWLRQTLQTAAQADASQLLDINVHMTKAASRSQSYLSLQQALTTTGGLAADQNAAELGPGALDDDLPCRSSGAVKAWHGRPDFEAVMRRLETEHAGSNIGVFYCGPPGLAAALSVLCLRHSAARKAFFHFRAERF